MVVVEVIDFAITHYLSVELRIINVCHFSLTNLGSRDPQNPFCAALQWDEVR